MTETTKPDKRKVRAYLDRRTDAEHDDPPPTPDDIRRELGWGLIPQSEEPEAEPRPSAEERLAQDHHPVGCVRERHRREDAALVGMAAIGKRL
ncbi:hypothetical protein [Massilia scottii]|uniref:hypothetical protein n=1 Tax=Massilia scottii TaxID=3057166 RepID=UPI002796B231|nr:hypothetical protein [Massilia sp. CCM 9029]MDQ1835543.1 hypothetical protein [Massilia sp. CCM 9029]